MGNVLGQPIALRFFLRSSMADTQAPADQLWWGSQSIALDIQNLPTRLVKLIPDAYASRRVKAHAWIPFITVAVGLGQL